MGSRNEETGGRYSKLEPPIPVEQMVEGVDVSPPAAERDDELREQEWVLRHANG
jgi:hypothetical protein